MRLGPGAPQIFRRRTSLRAAAFRRVENQNTLQHRYFPHYIAFSTSASGSSAEDTVLLATMSDYDDDMDVDAPASKNAVQFSSDNTSGKYKRAAADLPVEAQDNLPW